MVTSCLGSLGAFKERLTLGKAITALIKGQIKGQKKIKKISFKGGGDRWGTKKKKKKKKNQEESGKVGHE
ncbi:hypothetical protein ID0457_10460 [Helicobacter pylori]